VCTISWLLDKKQAGTGRSIQPIVMTSSTYFTYEIDFNNSIWTTAIGFGAGVSINFANS
jgi:hypothetical protein